jgi:diguanylate cyclase (GGDEF)-like protein
MEKHSRADHALQILAEIDRAILAGAKFERVIDIVLRASPALFGNRLVSITLLDRQDDQRATSYFFPPGSREMLPEDCAAPETSLLRRLGLAAESVAIDSPQSQFFLRQLTNAGATRVLLFPVFLDANLVGMLNIASLGQGTIIDPSNYIAGDFASRLSVAVTATARDQKIHQETNYDDITLLPNRRYLKDRLGQEIGRALREDRGCALLFIGMDHFKRVNDALGHSGGDAILEQTGRRIRHCLRTEDVVARFGGDEFLVLLPAIGSPNDAASVADKLVEALARPFVVHAKEHQLGATIGIAMFPTDGRTPDRLLRNAGFAISRAKTSERGQYLFYDEATNIAVQRRIELEADLRLALERKELTLAYQPQYDLRSGWITGVEALLRWHHPERGTVPPLEFIGIAERSNLIEEIGVYVRGLACRQFGAWQAEAIAPPRIAVNVSAVEMRRSGFAEQIRSELAHYGMRGGCLELELTESLLTENSEQVKATMFELRALEVQLAIDDFGTGYSSMAYLRDFPFTCLKIDRAFVAGIGRDSGAEPIVRAILGVAKGLDLEVVAEGIEATPQHAFLADEGCHLGQGYLWSEPLPAEGFARLMRDWIATTRPVLDAVALK